MPDLSTQQLKELFDQYGADLFALCYLQAGRPAQALDLMAAALCDMAANPRLWAQAASPRASVPGETPKPSSFFHFIQRRCGVSGAYRSRPPC